MDDAPRLAREKKTILAMMRIYCRAHHQSGENAPQFTNAFGVCGYCVELLDYAWCRLDHCPFGSQKPACNSCPIHCYHPNMREQVRAVMRYAGPRMLWRHPILAARHMLDVRQRVERPPTMRRH